MERLKITDNFQEQVRIGKEVFLTHPECYPKNVTDYLYEHLAEYTPGWSEDAKTEALYHSIYDYWIYGNDIEEEFIYGFLHKTHAEKSQYITVHSKQTYFDYLNDKDAEKIFADKYRTYCAFREEYRREVILLTGEEDYETFSAFVDRHPVFFVKPYSLALGKGIYKENLANWEGKRPLFEHLLRHGLQGGDYSWSLGCKVVLEELIPQADSMAILNPSSVNIIRLATVLIDGETKFAFACLRVGRKGRDAASATEGEIYCGINMESGVVETVGITDILERFEKHPDNGIQLKDFQVPRWDELLAFGSVISKRVPAVRYVGWDLALTDAGWVVVEGNEHGDFLCQNVFEKPCRDEFEKLIGFHNTKQYWWE